VLDLKLGERVLDGSQIDSGGLTRGRGSGRRGMGRKSIGDGSDAAVEDGQDLLNQRDGETDRVESALNAGG
jgi:hypothetical protein